MQDAWRSQIWGGHQKPVGWGLLGPPNLGLSPSRGTRCAACNPRFSGDLFL